MFLQCLKCHWCRLTESTSSNDGNMVPMIATWLKSLSHRKCMLACTVATSTVKSLNLSFMAKATLLTFCLFNTKRSKSCFFLSQVLWDVFWFCSLLLKKLQQNSAMRVRSHFSFGGVKCYEVGNWTLISISQKQTIIFQDILPKSVNDPKSRFSPAFVKSHLFIMRNIHLVFAVSFACRKYLALPCSCSIDYG